MYKWGPEAQRNLRPWNNPNCVIADKLRYNLQAAWSSSQAVTCLQDYQRKKKKTQYSSNSSSSQQNEVGYCTWRNIIDNTRQEQAILLDNLFHFHDVLALTVWTGIHTADSPQVSQREREPGHSAHYANEWMNVLVKSEILCPNWRNRF